MSYAPRHIPESPRGDGIAPSVDAAAAVDPFGSTSDWSQRPGVSWDSWGAFRSEDARRIGPTEVEFGSQWQTGAVTGGSVGLPWRVVWLEGTGEVIAVQWSSLDDGGAAGPVELMAVGLDRRTVDAALKDWWHMCGHVGSLDWVKRRLFGALPDLTDDAASRNQTS
ncbi:MAG: hypothetical protein ACI8Y4_002371 [Candidatus Poriferisodalaceae bacterium]|jgi:hypothetical protein